MFNLYVFEYASRVVYINKPMYHYQHQNDHSVTNSYNKNLYSQWQTLFLKMETYIIERKLSCEYEDALNNRIAMSILGLTLNTLLADFSQVEKRKAIRNILSSKKYRDAYKRLNFSYFPIYWKLFYKCAQYRFASGIYFFGIIIQKIRH